MVHERAVGLSVPVPLNEMFSKTVDPGPPEPEDKPSVTLDCARPQQHDANATIRLSSARLERINCKNMRREVRRPQREATLLFLESIATIVGQLVLSQLLFRELVTADQ